MGLLNEGAHDAAGTPRHPRPPRSPWRTFTEKGSKPATGWSRAQGEILGFYDTVEVALATQKRQPVRGNAVLTTLGDRLVSKRDEGSPHWYSPHWTASERKKMRWYRAEQLMLRTRMRRKEAEGALGRPSTAAPVAAEAVLHDHLDDYSPATFHRLVLDAFVDAHLTMHAIESRLSLRLDEHIARDDEFTEGRAAEQEDLNRCIALHTFVFAAARAFPWIFAEDGDEAAIVVRDYQHCWDNLTPTLCAWIPTQLSLLSLHRRAYCRLLAENRAEAFKDFHKLQRLIRDARRRLTRGTQQAAGSHEFLQGLAALADYHTGELYRTDHAHTQALEHFDAAITRIDQPVRAEAKRVTDNSRWYVELLISRGKAAYEMGQLKSSLSWYLRAWSAFLSLAAGDRLIEVYKDPIDEALAWLNQVALEPELHKPDAISYLKPVIQQVPGLAIPGHLTRLAGDLLLRMGHLLFVIRLGNEATEEDFKRVEAEAAKMRSRTGRPPYIELEGIRDGLAWIALWKAAQCDPHSTLVASDALKIKYRRQHPHPPKGTPWKGFDKLPPREPVDRQWPMGAEEFDSVTRLIEYLLLRELDNADDSQRSLGRKGQGDDSAIARDLLAGFVVHTDSIGVRKSQLHKYLLQKRRDTPPIGESGRPMMELVCMRRYGSLFPFLPRPSAFRVLGGGYLVRVYPVPESEGFDNFGIVIDPGPSFVENLYRCGFSLADIDAIVVTHDHPDHIVSLDPLLGLLHERDQLAPEPPPHGRAVVYGNNSVYERYAGKHPAPFENLSAGPVTLPNGIVLRAVPTGHQDLGGSSALGLHISAGPHGPAIAFSSDVPAPAPDARAWQQLWSDPLDADVLVAHLSSVPLVELREIAALGVPSGQLKREEAAFLRLWTRFAEANPGLHRRLEYASWINPKTKKPLPHMDPVGPVTGEWIDEKPHLYLGGILEWARAFRERHRDTPGVFVLGELSEELGTFRTKVAAGLNDTIFHSRDGCHALTADIGLTLTVRGGRDAQGKRIYDPCVLCTTCDLDNDLVREERYHRPESIVEVCVKGENEGVFYNCLGHDPSNQIDPTFLERMQRYDVFGR